MGQPTLNETTYEGVGFGLGFSVLLDPVKVKVMTSPNEHNQIFAGKIFLP
jgi:hypothetical protein